MNDQHARLRCNKYDRRKILERIERQALIQCLIRGQDSVITQEPGVAIGR